MNVQTPTVILVMVMMVLVMVMVMLMVMVMMMTMTMMITIILCRKFSGGASAPTDFASLFYNLLSCPSHGD